MSEVLSPSRLEAGLLNNPQIEQMITTNRALHAVVLELKSVLQTTVRQESTGNGDAAELHPSVLHEPTNNHVIRVTSADALGDSHLPEIHINDIKEKAALAATVEPTKDHFELDNEQARRRHEKRRQQEILRLKNRVSYKCR